MQGKTDAPIKARAMMYKAVVQAVLLCDSKIWGVIDETMKVLQVFYHIIDRQIAVMTAGKGLGELGIEDNRALAYKEVCEYVTGNNRGICIRETNIQTLYRRRADGGFK